MPDPINQALSIKFVWVRKFENGNPSLVWKKLLESNLSEVGRPDIATHLKLVSMEWHATSLLLRDISCFWADIFLAISQFIIMSHKYNKQYWHLTPITGNEHMDFTHINISSLAYRNPTVQVFTSAGLIIVGQLFNCFSDGRLNMNSVKSFDQIENEFNIILPMMLRNSITGLLNIIRAQNRMSPATPLPDTITTIQSLTRACKAGCQIVNRLILKQARQEWEWGEFPRSYSTYQQDGQISISPTQFSQALSRSRRTLLMPAVQWTSIQIQLRTLWTNVKEQRTNQNLLSLTPVDNMCTNCRNSPENTIHLILQCPLAQLLWGHLADSFNEVTERPDAGNTPITLQRDNIMFNHPPSGIPDHQKYDCIDAIMIAKHAIYRLKFRQNTNRLPTIKLLLVTVALDMERAVTVRNYMCKDSQLLADITDKLKTKAGF